MKYLPLFAFPVLLTACALTPEDQQAARVHQLEKEARENFIALKAQEHPGRPVVLHDDAPPPTPKSHLTAFRDEQPSAAAPKPYFAAQSTSPPRARRSADDTVYYWQVPPPPRQQTTPREQAAEAKYARSLAKRPEDLSSEERLYAHEHY